MTINTHYQGPYLKCARFLATWLRIRIGLGTSMGVSLALMIISGLQMASDGGSFASTNGIGAWAVNICQASPYIYLQPFSFTAGSSGSSSYCGWPSPNSNLRLICSVFGFVATFALFFKSPLSKWARSILLFFTSIHFASFVLDASQATAGANACTTKFPNTDLGTTIGGSSITCSSVNYSGITVLNFIQVVLYYLLFETWSMCANLYNQTSDDGDDDDDDQPKKKRRKRRGDDGEEDEEEGGDGQKSTRNPLQDFDEDGEDEDGNPKRGYKKLTPEQAAALEKQNKKSWCAIL